MEFAYPDQSTSIYHFDSPFSRSLQCHIRSSRTALQAKKADKQRFAKLSRINDNGNSLLVFRSLLLFSLLPVFLHQFQEHQIYSGSFSNSFMIETRLEDGTKPNLPRRSIKGNAWYLQSSSFVNQGYLSSLSGPYVRFSATQNCTLLALRFPPLIALNSHAIADTTIL